MIDAQFTADDWDNAVSDPGIQPVFYLVATPGELRLLEKYCGHEVQEGETFMGMQVVFARRLPEK